MFEPDDNPPDEKPWPWEPDGIMGPSRNGSSEEDKQETSEKSRQVEIERKQKQEGCGCDCGCGK